MKSMPTTAIGTSVSSMLSTLLVGRAGHPRLQRLELGIDLLGGTQLGDFILEALGRRTHASGFGAAFGEIDPALERLEAAERLVDLGAVGHFTQPGAVLGRFQPGD